ncbi:unnamed protein product [Meganyctiphanes norvegica]|uniref:Uncharacterized protein n=1 Tax=Meganyctiphanes norvegica TaxID=48144 RepID=A0AAV2S5L8_MEGNR
MFVKGLIICLVIVWTSAAPDPNVNVQVDINVNGGSAAGGNGGPDGIGLYGDDGLVCGKDSCNSGKCADGIKCPNGQNGSPMNGLNNIPSTVSDGCTCEGSGRLCCLD